MPASLLVACCLTLLHGSWWHGSPSRDDVSGSLSRSVMAGSEIRPNQDRSETYRTTDRSETSPPNQTSSVTENLAAFFDRLIARYRELASYRDLTRIVQITHGGPGSNAQAQRTETQMICDILDGELRIITPGSQLRDSLRQTLGLSVRVAGETSKRPGALPWGTAQHNVKTSNEEPEESPSHGLADSSSQPADLALRYRLWLAPHLALKFADDPLNEFRSTAEEPFTASEPAAVMVEDRVMVHVELKSGRTSVGHDAPEDYDATFDLYVNPESMLIERIEGRERLPDGGSVETTYTIQPMVANGLYAQPEPVPSSVGDEEIDAEPEVEETIEPVASAAPASGVSRSHKTSRCFESSS